ncbi:hypothetical protein BY996DRAFT_7905531 [Phakopsora pachyrhizi]|nr:hypothetical protein BY996DRAFT_8046549 [Phakopsora pachyrhizi]KAI8445869.1 hypothetical protein BY996DRAFT_7905531 [Phakopsora pachyrhizi]
MFRTLSTVYLFFIFCKEGRFVHNRLLLLHNPKISLKLFFISSLLLLSLNQSNGCHHPSLQVFCKVSGSSGWFLLWSTRCRTTIQALTTKLVSDSDRT